MNTIIYEKVKTHIDADKNMDKKDRVIMVALAALLDVCGISITPDATGLYADRLAHILNSPEVGEDDKSSDTEAVVKHSLGGTYNNAYERLVFNSLNCSVNGVYYSNPTIAYELINDTITFKVCDDAFDLGYNDDGTNKVLLSFNYRKGHNVYFKLTNGIGV